MQSHLNSDTDEHSCFDSLKRTIMGCCYSLCHKDPQDNRRNERTPLLPAPEELPPPRVNIPNPSTRKPDEQSALSRILQEAATSVIDVGALGPHTLESHECSERMKAYQARLAVTNKGPVNAVTPCLLKDIPQAQKVSALSAPPVNPTDVDLIKNAVKKAAEAMSGMRVEHREDLVVPFKIP